MKIVKTKTSDGFHFNGLLSEANNSKKIIIHIHGMAGSILLEEYYGAMHERYPQHRISFLAGEHRGTGTITAFIHETTDGMAGNAFERFEECVYDIQAWIDFARNLGYEDIWLQGHSLAPSKIAYYIHQTKKPMLAGLIWLSPSDMMGLVRNPQDREDHVSMLAEARGLVREGRGNILLRQKLWGSELISAQTYLNFFDIGAKTAVFNYVDDQLGWDVVNSIDLPVLAITGTKDDGIVSVLSVPEAMKKLESELKRSPRVKTIVYEGAEHSFNGFGNRIVDDVLDFIGNSDSIR